jgi:alanine racemase
VLAVVKANAYGHGLVPAARILDGADGFAVARMDEAMQLRDAGITKRLVILGGFVGPEEAALAASLRLDCVIHSLSQVEVLERMSNLAPLDLWIKIDTGMGRLGLEPEAWPEARRRLGACAAGRGTIRLMTHLASADDPTGSSTPTQLTRFRDAMQGWSGGVSVANSAAIVQWPESLDLPGIARSETWIRPGLMLYGVSPLPEASGAALGLQPAMSFETRLIAVRSLPRGHRVGYGGDWCAERDSVVGIAAAGYADGYPWHRGQGTPVLVNGHLAPVIGRVSMDMISIDLTGNPACSPGDPVVLWGDAPVVEEVARLAGTISYELLAAISPRVVRQLEEQAPLSPGRIPS